uniref:Trans-1,2-dihydrobenzene-1,2-diol dehydrogenase n=1 Tax=Ciona savignyi TaxID=51511 RepID=H2ZJX9_CIOSA
MKDGLLNWGICSAGKISNDFALALQNLPTTEHQICAVAARDGDRAKEFADKLKIPKYYSSYKELAENPEIDVVYIGAVNTQHYNVAKLMMESGKHVLCEKPLCVNSAETTGLLNIAREKNVFLMEAIWSRCFPAYSKLKELIASGVIGEVGHVQVSFGEFSSKLVPRIELKELAGGALLDRGIYAIQFAQFVFDEKPINQITMGSLIAPSGPDNKVHIILQYPNNKTAIVSTSLLENLPNEGVICGTKGVIRVCFPVWCPTKIEVSVKYKEKEIFEFPLPPTPDMEGCKFVFRNGQGLKYEAEEVRRCIINGLTESPLLTHNMSQDIADIMDSARKSIGYKLPQDKE